MPTSDGVRHAPLLRSSEARADSRPRLFQPMNNPERPSAAPADFRSAKALTTTNAVRAILGSKGLTLYRVAELTRARYPDNAAYHIRRNFYFQLRSGLSPAIEQIVAFAEVTGLRFRQWLEIFGFSLRDIPRVQAILDRNRTGLIDQIMDPELLIPRFRYRQPPEDSRDVTPMSQLLERAGTERASTLLQESRRDFFYAKIGREDQLAFPELLPGSVVRADPHLVHGALPRTPGESSRHLFLLDTRRGLSCARIRHTGANRFAIAVMHPDIPATEFHIGTEDRILGVIDVELRFQHRPRKQGRTGAIPSPIAIFPGTSGRMRLHASGATRSFLERARQLAGLTFRAASNKSREIAEILGDSRYFTSPSALSDYEAHDALPRHIHKLFTLTILYGLRFQDLIRLSRIDIDTNHLGARRTHPHKLWSRVDAPPTLFEHLLGQFEDVPLFLLDALPALTGLTSISVRDVFWLGGQSHPVHPALKGAAFVLVNRRSKNPRFLGGTPHFRQPVYLLEERNGSRFFATCSIEGRRLVVHPDPQGAATTRAVYPRADVEVLGQVVAVARSLLPVI